MSECLSLGRLLCNRDKALVVLLRWLPLIKLFCQAFYTDGVIGPIQWLWNVGRT